MHFNRLHEFVRRPNLVYWRVLHTFCNLSDGVQRAVQTQEKNLSQMSDGYVTRADYAWLNAHLQRRLWRDCMAESRFRCLGESANTFFKNNMKRLGRGMELVKVVTPVMGIGLCFGGVVKDRADGILVVIATRYIRKEEI